MIVKKHRIFQIILFKVLLLSFLSCDPYYEIEWYVKNNTENSISIFSKTWQDSIEINNSLSQDSSILLLNDFDNGTVRSHIEYMEIKKPPFDHLLIINSKGDSLQKDAYLIDNWNVKNIDDEIVEYTLEIFESDFK